MPRKKTARKSPPKRHDRPKNVLKRIPVELHLVAAPDADQYRAMNHLDVEKTRALNELLASLVKGKGKDSLRNGGKVVINVASVNGTLNPEDLFGRIQLELSRYTMEAEPGFELAVDSPPDKKELYYYRDKTGTWCTYGLSLERIDADRHRLGRWIEHLKVEGKPLDVEIRLGVRHEMV